MKVQRGREALNLIPLTEHALLNLKHGSIIYEPDGRRWRVTSVKRWKTRPRDREYGLKHGLYAYGRLHVHDGRTSQGTFYKSRSGW